MKKKNIQSLLRSGLLSGACVAAFTTTAAFAQDSSMETVVVTGLRGSLQRSLDVKREAPGIVDAISAEDIGKFPDTNLAEAMMRIPGVTVTRGRGTATGGTGGTSATGEATQITVRGFGPTFIETLFDDRKVATGAGSRAFDFSSISSDFVGQIAILKSPDASLSSGAIGATINVKFPKPFDKPGLVVASSIGGQVSPERGAISPNGSVLISNTFANDTFGILFAGSYSDTRTRQNHINNQGWEGKYAAKRNDDGTISPTYGSYPKAADGHTLTPTEALTTPTWFTQDYGIYREIENVERIQGRLVLQWRPTDAIEITLNDNFSRDNDHQAQYGYSVWFNPGSMSNVQLDKNGTVVNFSQTTPTDFQGQYNPQLLQYNDYGANVKWQVTEKFGLTFDFNHADGWLNPANQIGIDVDVGYGNGNSNTVMGIVVPEGHGIPYPTFYGPDNDKSKFINNGLIGSHVIPMTMGKNLDTINQVKIQGDWIESDALALKFGFQYVAEHKNQESWDTFENNNWQAYSGYGPASGNKNGVALPQDLFAKSFSTSGFISGWSGSENLPAAILQYDPWPTLNYLNGLKGAGADMNCCNPNGSGDVGRPFDGTYRVAFNPGSYLSLQEKTYSGFFQATMKTELAKMPLRVNLGARYDITQEDMAGLGRTVSSFRQQSGDLTAWEVIYGNSGAITPIVGQHSYQYLLPNVDFTLSVTDNIDVRFNVSRTLTRPPISQLNPVLNVGSSRVGQVTVSGGNPNLLPFLSDNIDFGAQWYYAPNSYLSVNSFLKAVDNFVISQSRGATYGAVGNCIAATPAPCTMAGQVVDVPYTITQPVNGPAANVYGLEIAWQHVFGESGFGFSLNGTIVGTNKPYDQKNLSVSGFSVTGLADSANLMVFYDKDGFQARLAANWQDTYLDHFGHIQNGSDFGTEPTFVNTSWNLDFSTSYDLDEHLTVYFQAKNLTNATYSTHGRYSNQVLDIVDYGRMMMAGVHFKL